MGNRAKPSKLKLLMGNPGKKKINKLEPEPERGIPAMPKWLREFPLAVEAWERDAAILEGMGVMTKADGLALAKLCYMESELINLALEIKQEGRVAYTARMDSLGNEVMDAKGNPKTTQHQKLFTEHRMLAGLFGFDPASRSKLSVNDGATKSKFDGLVGVKGGKK